jgi:hypothetical protein
MLAAVELGWGSPLPTNLAVEFLGMITKVEGDKLTFVTKHGDFTEREAISIGDSVRVTIKMLLRWTTRKA